MHGQWSREGKILPADGGGARHSLPIPQLLDRLMNPCSVQPESSLPLPSIPYTRQASVFVASFTLLGLLGWVDYLTGYELGFFVFYSAPIGLTAWYAGRWPAVAIALFASVTWWLADRSNGVVYSSRFFFYWNLTIHFLAFVINAVTIAKIRRDLDERHQLLAELRQSRIGPRPNTAGTCPNCGYRPASHDPVT